MFESGVKKGGQETRPQKLALSLFRGSGARIVVGSRFSTVRTSSALAEATVLLMSRVVVTRRMIIVSASMVSRSFLHIVHFNSQACHFYDKILDGFEVKIVQNRKAVHLMTEWIKVDEKFGDGPQQFADKTQQTSDSRSR
jgi:hypothetical protein